MQAAMRPVSPAIAVEADAPLVSAMAKMAGIEPARLLVIEDRRLVGLLTKSPVLRHARVREELAA